MSDPEFGEIDAMLHARSRMALSPQNNTMASIDHDELDENDFRDLVWSELFWLIAFQIGREFRWAGHLWDSRLPHHRRGALGTGKYRRIKPGVILCEDGKGTVMQLTYVPRRGDASGKMEVAVRIPLTVTKGILLSKHLYYKSHDLWRQKLGNVVKMNIVEWSDLVDINYAMTGPHDDKDSLPKGTYALVATIDGIQNHMSRAHAGWVAKSFATLVGASLLLAKWGADYAESDDFTNWVLFHNDRYEEEDFGSYAKTYLCDSIGPYRYDSATYPMRTYTLTADWDLHEDDSERHWPDFGLYIEDQD